MESAPLFERSLYEPRVAEIRHSCLGLYHSLPNSARRLSNYFTSLRSLSHRSVNCEESFSDLLPDK
jgi:hypothetical protein